VFFSIRLLAVVGSVLRFSIVCNGSKLPEGPDVSIGIRMRFAVQRMVEVRDIIAQMDGPKYHSKTFSVFPICKTNRALAHIDSSTTVSIICLAEAKIGNGLKIDKRNGVPDTPILFPGLICSLI